MVSPIENELRAGYPLLYIHTHEPHAVYRKLQTDIKSFSEWNNITGFTAYPNTTEIHNTNTAPNAFLEWLSIKTNHVLLAHNLHFYLQDPEIIQSIILGTAIWKRQGNTLAVVSPVISIPPELDKFFHLVDIPLPDEDQLTTIQRNLASSYNIPLNNNAVKAAMGLTEFEAETAFALSMVKSSCFDPNVIIDIKAQMIRKSGKMQFWPPVPIEHVGGLDLLKSWLNARREALLPASTTKYKPNGILIVGVPGTGKSLISKATASIFERPLLNLNLSALKGSLVGQSEQNILDACRLIKAFGPCVVWCDEIEKALGSAKSSHATGDTSGSMLGILLTQMQESLDDAFFCVTANAIDILPSEFIRRFDAVFFVDIPNVDERRQILEIMNKKYETTIDPQWAEKLENYTGSEIEQFVKDSIFDGPQAAYDSIVPLAKSMREQITELRTWASGRARPANTKPQPPSPKTDTRSVILSFSTDTKENDR